MPLHPLHDNLTAASVLAQNNENSDELRERVSQVVQDLAGWQFFLDDQSRRLGEISKFTTKYLTFRDLIKRIGSLKDEIERAGIANLNSQQVGGYEKHAGALYNAVLSAANMHRDKGAKGITKGTFFRKPQSAQEFEVISPPGYRCL